MGQDNKINQNFVVYPPYHVSKYAPVDREQKRRYLREVEKVNLALFQIEASFYNELFNPDNNESYNSIYTRHLDAFNYEINRLKREGKFRFIKLVEDYFAQLFQPIEL